MEIERKVEKRARNEIKQRDEKVEEKKSKQEDFY